MLLLKFHANENIVHQTYNMTLSFYANVSFLVLLKKKGEQYLILHLLYIYEYNNNNNELDNYRVWYYWNPSPLKKKTKNKRIKKQIFWCPHPY